MHIIQITNCLPIFPPKLAHFLLNSKIFLWMTGITVICLSGKGSRGRLTKRVQGERACLRGIRKKAKVEMHNWKIVPTLMSKNTDSWTICKDNCL
jgi:hypothetical protein